MSWQMLATLTITVEQGRRSTQIIDAMAMRHLDRSDHDLEINELMRALRGGACRSRFDPLPLSRARFPDIAGRGTIAVPEVTIEI
jgi:hypothetical protein